MRANFVFSEVWIGLRRNLTMTIAVIVTVAVAMAMLGVALMIRSQASLSRGYWAGKIEVVVYLCHKKDSPYQTCKTGGPATEQTSNALLAELKKMPQVKEATYVNPQQAWEQFKAGLDENNPLLQTVKAEDLPPSIAVKLHNEADASAVESLARGRPGVASVINQENILKNFFDLMDKLLYLAVGIAIIQLIAAILLIANTMRLSAYNRRRETGIMRLVGASNLYIQLPFLLEGVIAGVIGGVFASGILLVVKRMLFDGLQTNIAIAAARLGWGDAIWTMVLSFVVGVLICAISSFVTLRRYLRV